MYRYKIYCNEEQTKKALELGADIETSPYFPQVRYEVRNFFVKDDIAYHYPTAEQMIGWLEEQGFYFGLYSTVVYVEMDFRFLYEKSGGSRKEATLAAIDAALDYLIKNKE